MPSSRTPNDDAIFRCNLVSKDASGKAAGGIAERRISDLPPGDVLIRVHYTSLNYKDALAATGHPGVAKTLPHVPGIDAAGSVVQSASPEWKPGEDVVVTGFELGAGQWGGWAQYIRVPADWVMPLPKGLSPREAMIYGTAGVTAALSVLALQREEITPTVTKGGVALAPGEIVVTGATGGVGCLAVMLLANLGYKVAAVSGKPDRHEWLKSLGAARVLSREDVNDTSGKPMLPVKWAGAIDTVGGNTLSTIIRSTQIGGCVTAMGMVGGTELPLSIYPFILRGVKLAGITSSWSPYEMRRKIWEKFAADWKLEKLESVTQETALADVGPYVQKILAGQLAGRVVIRLD